MGGKHDVTGQADFEVENALVAELSAPGNQEISVQLKANAPTLMGILGIMQLALRQPALDGFPVAKEFEQWARAIEVRLAELGPATARLCEMGWSPENDRLAWRGGNRGRRRMTSSEKED
jgi:hypothetical protein